MDNFIKMYEDFKNESKDFVDHFPPLEVIYHNPAITFLDSDAILELVLSLVNLKRKPKKDDLIIFKNWIEKYQKMRKNI